MSIDFQNSNAMVSAVRPASRSKKASKTRSRNHSEDWDFAGLLAGQEVDEDSIPEVLKGVPGLGLNLPLDPSVFMQQLYGREFDPATGRVNHGVFLQQTQDKTASLSETLAQLFSEHDIDQSHAMSIEVSELGVVEVSADSHPDADTVTQMFAEDFDLSQAYRDVSQAHHWAALTEIGGAYVEAWYATDDFDQRDDITDLFRDIFDSLAETASHMTYTDGTLNSTSVAVALKALDELSPPPADEASSN